MPGGQRRPRRHPARRRRLPCWRTARPRDSTANADRDRMRWPAPLWRSSGAGAATIDPPDGTRPTGVLDSCRRDGDAPRRHDHRRCAPSEDGGAIRNAGTLTLIDTRRRPRGRRRAGARPAPASGAGSRAAAPSRCSGRRSATTSPAPAAAGRPGAAGGAGGGIADRAGRSASCRRGSSGTRPEPAGAGDAGQPGGRAAAGGGVFVGPAVPPRSSTPCSWRTPREPVAAAALAGERRERRVGAAASVRSGRRTCASRRS